MTASDGPLPVGVPVDAGFSVPFRLRGPVTGAEVYIAERLQPDLPVTVLQVLWPDPAGRFPDEPGYDHAGFPQQVLDLDDGDPLPPPAVLRIVDGEGAS
jgi:hypothetical protein